LSHCACCATLLCLLCPPGRNPKLTADALLKELNELDRIHLVLSLQVGISAC